MLHDPALARAARALDPRPRSAVSTGCGLAGLAGLLCWVAVARWYGMDGPFSALTDLVACGLPMVLWSVLVAHGLRRGEGRDLLAVKIAGGIIASARGGRTGWRRSHTCR